MVGVSCWISSCRVRMWEQGDLVRKGVLDWRACEWRAGDFPGWTWTAALPPLLFTTPGLTSAGGIGGEKWHECGKRSVWCFLCWALCSLFPPYEKDGREIPAKVPDTGILREEYSNKREENTWEWVLTTHLSQCDPNQKALALTQNDLFPCCRSAHFHVCYLLLHGSFRAEMIERSLPWYLIAVLAGCLVGLTHQKCRCLGKYCLFLV